MDYIFRLNPTLLNYFCYGVMAAAIYFLTFKSKKIPFLNKFIFVPARKSTTNAVQLGGLGLSTTILTSVIIFMSKTNIPDNLIDLMVFWLVGGFLITLYGYFDDKFELRPIVKLMMQFGSIIAFSIGASQALFPQYSAIAFVTLMFYGLGVLNGSNLLDGLDTLTFKLGSITLFCYIFLASDVSPVTTYFATIFHAPLMAFYFFNKEPSKIHLGEIGGSFIGYTFLLLSCFLFIDRAELYPGTDHLLNNLSYSLMPLTLPMVELGISFLRRIYNKKSPFKGDKFHVHHILRNYHKFSPSMASTVMGALYFMSLFVTFSVHHYTNAIAAYFTLVGSLIFGYLAIGKKFWNGSDTINLSLTSLLKSLRKSDVTVIESSVFDDFKLEIYEESLDEESSLDSPDEGKDEEKAA